MSPGDPLWPLVPCCDAMVTGTVTGGACDLCLTNGCFIIPRATSMGPVFMALYFRLNPQQCPSITVARDLYWRWWLGLEEERAQVLSRLMHRKSWHRLWTMAHTVSHISNGKWSLTFLNCKHLRLRFVHDWIRSPAGSGFYLDDCLHSRLLKVVLQRQVMHPVQKYWLAYWLRSCLPSLMTGPVANKNAK